MPQKNDKTIELNWNIFSDPFICNHPCCSSKTFRHCVQHGTLLRAGDALNALDYVALCILRAPCCEKIEPLWRNSSRIFLALFRGRLGSGLMLVVPRWRWVFFGVTRDWLEARLRTKLLDRGLIDRAVIGRRRMGRWCHNGRPVGGHVKPNKKTTGMRGAGRSEVLYVVHTHFLKL